nr:endothelin-converting enzyme 1-like [Onthophagus taurus]
MIKLFKMYPLIKINVEIDFKNTSKYALYLSPPNLNLPKYILLNPMGHEKEIYSYKKWIINSIIFMFDKKINFNEINEIIQFEVKLARLIHRGKQKREVLKVFNKKTLINWTEYLNIIFFGSKTKVIDEDYIYYNDFVVNLLRLIRETKKSTVSNYLMWCLIKEFSRDVSVEMKEFNFEVNRAILGVKSDVPRNEECVSKLTEFFGGYLINSYIKYYLKNEDFIKINRIAENVRAKFVEVLKNNKWLSPQTKKVAIEKVIGVKFYVGYHDGVDVFYGNLTNNNYFGSLLELKRDLVVRHFNKFESKVGIEFPDNLFEVNAYYNVLQNSIIISVGLLEEPFYHRDRPAVLNYGSLGTLIGHELAHTLDVTGRKSDKSGNLKRWFSIKDAKIHNKRMECFENRYKQNYNNQFQDGIIENMADIIGLQLSYDAYVSSRKVFGAIPFLETFGDKEIFFMSYAQTWCEIIQNDSLDILQDEHPQNKIRVLESVLNNGNFLKIFQCRDETSKKCDPIW